MSKQNDDANDPLVRSLDPFNRNPKLDPVGSDEAPEREQAAGEPDIEGPSGRAEAKRQAPKAGSGTTGVEVEPIPMDEESTWGFEQDKKKGEND